MKPNERTDLRPSEGHVLRMRPLGNRGPYEGPPDPPDPPGPPDPPDRFYPSIPRSTPPDVIIHLTSVTAADAVFATHPDTLGKIQAGLAGRLVGVGKPQVRVLRALINREDENGPQRVMIGVWLWSIVPPSRFLDATDQATWKQIENDVRLSQELGLRAACGLGATPTPVAVPSGANTACVFASMTMLRRMAVEAFSATLRAQTALIFQLRARSIHIDDVPPRSLKTSVFLRDEDTGVESTLHIDEDMRVTSDGRVVADPPGSGAVVNFQWLAWMLVPISGRLYDIISAIQTIAIYGFSPFAGSLLPTTLAAALCNSLFMNKWPLRNEVAGQNVGLDHILAFTYTEVSARAEGVIAEGSWALARRVPTVQIHGATLLVARPSQPVAESVYTLTLDDFLPGSPGGFTATFSGAPGAIASVQPAGPFAATVRFNAAGVPVHQKVTLQLDVRVTGIGTDQAMGSHTVQIHMVPDVQGDPFDPEETKCRQKPWLCDDRR